MHARQVMTRKVITVRSETPVVEAANIMLREHISGLPVVDEAGKLIGILSQSDFIRRVEIGTQKRRGRWLQFFVGPSKLASDFVRERGREVGEIMTSDVRTITETTSLADAVKLMDQHNLKRLPVVEMGHVVGIVTRTNLLQAFASLAREVPDPTADDDHIRDRIFATLEKSDWRPFGLVVAVLNGVVQLSGVVVTDESRRAAIVAAENVSGVIKVHDHLCWIEPMSGTYFNSQEDEDLLKVS